MRILVDADACPVKQVVIKVAKEHKLPVIMFIDTSHQLNDGYSEVVTVDTQRDSVDIALINRTNAEDIVITQDYGLAALALARSARAINQNGIIYSPDNMDRFLFERHISQKIRRSGGRTAGPKKRTRADDERFEVALRGMIGQVHCC
ncbi:MAG: YaiI/YqxD family protein [Thermacetogeniaceae bacterium]